jgi:mannose-6-phosphate isomerase-like protein (cupin superfamily)
MARRIRLPVMAESGNGYAVSSLDELGEGYGFRKIRRGLGVTAFGINAIVLPPHYETGVHYHEQQEETYFIHQGEVEFRFGDGSKYVLGPGGMARVDAKTPRGMRNVGETDAIVVVAGGKDGYVGRDGVPVDPEGGRRDAGGPPGAGGTPGAGGRPGTA